MRCTSSPSRCSMRPANCRAIAVAAPLGGHRERDPARQHQAIGDPLGADAARDPRHDLGDQDADEEGDGGIGVGLRNPRCRSIAAPAASRCWRASAMPIAPSRAARSGSRTAGRSAPARRSEPRYGRSPAPARTDRSRRRRWRPATTGRSCGCCARARPGLRRTSRRPPPSSAPRRRRASRSPIQNAQQIRIATAAPAADHSASQWSRCRTGAAPSFGMEGQSDGRDVPGLRRSPRSARGNRAR